MALFLTIPLFFPAVLVVVLPVWDGMDIDYSGCCRSFRSPLLLLIGNLFLHGHARKREIDQRVLVIVFSIASPLSMNKTGK